MSTYIVMVSGSQDFQSYDKIFHQMQKITKNRTDDHIIAVPVATTALHDVVVDCANRLGWEVQGDTAHADMLLAFPVKRCEDTWSSVRKAWKNGIRVQVYS